MKRLLMFTALVSLAANAVAEAVYTYDDADNRNYVVTVPADETAEISSTAVALLNGGTVTNFIKRGDGVLVVGSVLDSYTGSVCVEDGIYRMKPEKTDNTACGARSGGGDIIVSDGATLSLRTTTEKTTLSGKKIVFGGRGHNGIGALYVEPETTQAQTGVTFCNTFELASDALVRNASSFEFRFSSYWQGVDMNGHSLTFSNSGDYSKQVVVGFAGANNDNYAITDPGPIYGIEGGIKFGNNFWQNLSGAANTLTISNSAAFVFNATAASASRKLIMAPGSRFSVAAGDKSDNMWYNNWAGSIQLEGEELTPIDSPTDWRYSVFLSGQILSGGLRIRQRMPLHLARRWSANNLDKGIVVDNGGTVNIWYANSLTDTCGPLVVTNGTVWFKSDSYAESTSKNVLSLPTATFHGNTSVTGNCAYGCWKGSLTKTGAGDLKYDAWVGAPELRLEGGRFLMPAGSYTGTIANVPTLPVFTNLTAKSGTEIGFAGNSYSVKNLTGSTTLTDCPTFTVDGQWTISADEAVSGSKLETAGSFAFGAGASVALTPPASTVIGTRTYTVLTAEGGITGFTPGIVADHWHTSLSADGKSVLLTHVGQGFKVIFR